VNFNFLDNPVKDLIYWVSGGLFVVDS